MTGQEGQAQPQGQDFRAKLDAVNARIDNITPLAGTETGLDAAKWAAPDLTQLPRVDGGGQSFGEVVKGAEAIDAHSTGNQALDQAITEFARGESAVLANTPNTSIPPQTSDRPGYWKPATQEQIDNAAKYGFDLQAANDKYYPNHDKAE